MMQLAQAIEQRSRPRILRARAVIVLLSKRGRCHCQKHSGGGF